MKKTNITLYQPDGKVSVFMSVESYGFTAHGALAFKPGSADAFTYGHQITTTLPYKIAEQ